MSTKNIAESSAKTFGVNSVVWKYNMQNGGNMWNSCWVLIIGTFENVSLFSGKKHLLNWVEEYTSSIRDMGSTKFPTQYMKLFFVALRSEFRVRQNRRPRVLIRDTIPLLRSFNSDMINQVIISRKRSKEQPTSCTRIEKKFSTGNS